MTLIITRLHACYNKKYSIPRIALEVIFMAGHLGKACRIAMDNNT